MLWFDVLLAGFLNLPVSKAGQIWVSRVRPSGESMMRTLALAEMPQIDHRVSQARQGVVQLTDPLEAQQ